MASQRTYFLLLFICISLYGFSQRELHVNGKAINTSTCAEIKVLKPIPSGQVGITCDIRDAQITGDCLELTVVYGGCNGNLELYTDNTIAESGDAKLQLKLLWQEPSFCKALILVKVSFDLSPYKTLVKDKMAVIKVMDTNFELYYN